MRALKLIYYLLVIAGCFPPLSWISFFKRIIYNIYKSCIIIMLCIFLISQIMDVILNVKNPDDITENLYMMLTVSVGTSKVVIMWMNYENIATLINSLNDEPFKPMDSNEVEIRKKYDKIIRINTLRYMILIETTCIFFDSISFFTDFRHRKLKYRVWIPYNYSSHIIFCLTYYQQILSTSHAATINVACDTLICGLLVHVHCQIEILQYRLRKMSTNPDTLGYCVRHHNHILELARSVNANFTLIIGFQFIASTLIICATLYQLKNSALGTNQLLLIMYACCILAEVYIYCWFGNKVKTKSLQLVDSIFQMDWPALNNSLKKSLLIIMKRAMVPIEFTSAHILIMNLDSFVALLKTAYSVYNLLVRI